MWFAMQLLEVADYVARTYIFRTRARGHVSSAARTSSLGRLAATCALVLFAVNPASGGDSFPNTGPSLSGSGVSIGIGVYKRSYKSPFTRYCDDPYSLDKRLHLGSYSGRVDEGARYDPYGYRDDLGFFTRSWRDRDDEPSTRSPLSSGVHCALSVALAGGGDEIAFRQHYPSSSERAYPPSDLLSATPSLEDELREVYEQSGWTPLSDGRTQDALARFDELSRRNPQRGVPRVGIALANAELGRQRRAITAMRKALQLDGEALYHVPVDAKLRKRLGALASSFSGEAEGADTDFMRAALLYLTGEEDAARLLIDRAQTRGDHSASSAALRHLVHERPRR